MEKSTFLSYSCHSTHLFALAKYVVRGECYYSDYAIGVDTKKGNESAEFVVEAKYRISSNNDLIEAFQQAQSYALRLASKYILIVALEGIWLFSKLESKFNPKPIIFLNWTQSQKSEYLLELSKTLSPRNLLK